MDILGLMSVLSFGLTCFGIGYSFGKDNSNAKKQPLLSDERSGHFNNLVGIAGGQQSRFEVSVTSRYLCFLIIV